MASRKHKNWKKWREEKEGIMVKITLRRIGTFFRASVVEIGRIKR
jgi:hypothetical protein